MDSPPSCSGVEDDRRSLESDSPDSDDLDRNPPEPLTSSKAATSIQPGDLETSADLNSDDSDEDEPPPIRRNLFSNTASSRPLPSTPRLKPVELTSQDKSSSPPPPLAFPPLPYDNDDQQHQAQPSTTTRATSSSSSSSSSGSSSSTIEVPPDSHHRRRNPTTPPRPRPTAHILADWARDHTPFRALQDAVMQGRAAENQIEYYWQLVQEVTDEEAVRFAKDQEAWVEAGLAKGGGGKDEGGTERGRDEDEEGDEATPKSVYGGKLDEWYVRYQRGETSTGGAGHVKSLPWDGDEVMEDARDSHARERCSTPGPEGAGDEKVHGGRAKAEEEEDNDDNDRTYNPFRQKSPAKKALTLDEDYDQDDAQALDGDGNSKGDEMDWQSSEDDVNDDKSELQRGSRRASGCRILEGLISRAQTRSKKLQEVQAKEDEDGEQPQRGGGGGTNRSRRLKLRIGLGGAVQDGRLLGQEGEEVVDSVEGDGRVDGDLE